MSAHGCNPTKENVIGLKIEITKQVCKFNCSTFMIMYKLLMPGSNLANSITPGMLIFENKLLSPNDHNYVDMARELLRTIFISIKEGSLQDCSSLFCNMLEKYRYIKLPH